MVMMMMPTILMIDRDENDRYYDCGDLLITEHISGLRNQPYHCNI